MATLLTVEKKQSSSPCRREQSFYRSQFTMIWLSPWWILGEHASHYCTLNKTTSYESMNSLKVTVVTKEALAIVVFDVHLHALMAMDHILQAWLPTVRFWQDSPDTLISVPIVDSSSCACCLEDRQGQLMTAVVYGAIHTPFMGWRLQNNGEKSCISWKQAFYRNLQIGNSSKKQACMFDLSYKLEWS